MDIIKMWEEERWIVCLRKKPGCSGSKWHKGEEWFGNVLGVKSKVGERTRAKQGVELILKQKLWEYVKDCMEMNSGQMWVKMRVDGNRWLIISTYASGHEKKDHEASVLGAAEWVCQ